MSLKITTLLGVDNEPGWYFCTTDAAGEILNRYAVVGNNIVEQRANAHQLAESMSRGEEEFIECVRHNLLGVNQTAEDLYKDLITDQNDCILEATLGQTVPEAEETGAYFASETAEGDVSLAEVLLDLGRWLALLL